MKSNRKKPLKPEVKKVLYARLPVSLIDKINEMAWVDGRTQLETVRRLLEFALRERS